MEKGIIVHTIIFNSNKEILLIKRSITETTLPGYWDIPGGTLENGEDPICGAIRETLEETGIKIIKPNLFFHTSNIDTQKNKQFVRMVFIAQTPTSQVILNQNDHEEYKWININSTLQLKVVDYIEDCFKLLKSKKHELLKFI